MSAIGRVKIGQKRVVIGGFARRYRGDGAKKMHKIVVEKQRIKKKVIRKVKKNFECIRKSCTFASLFQREKCETESCLKDCQKADITQLVE